MMLIFVISSCTTTVEVTREVPVQVTVEVPGPEVVVTRVIEREVVTEVVEVTRIVEVDTAAGRPQGNLVIELSQPPVTLDVAEATDADSLTAAWQLYDSLLYLNERGAIRPALAESWDISQDGRIYTFNLRPNVFFHNGEPFNADAVLFSWQRAQLSETSNAQAWAAAETVEVIDDLTFVVTTAAPDPFFLTKVAQYWAIVPPGYIGREGEEGFAAAPVGTGPFMFVEAQPNDFVRLRANPNYWDPNLPKLQSLTFRFITDPEARRTGLRNGSLHIVKSVTAEDADALYLLTNVDIINYPQDQIYYIAFNNQTTGANSPLADPQVRQALNYAVNRQAITNELFDRYAQPANSLFTPLNFGFDNTLTRFTYDPLLAQSLLEEAGYASGFTVEFVCPDMSFTNFNEVCEMVQADLATIGINANLTFISPDIYFESYDNGELPPLAGNQTAGQGGEIYDRLQNLLGENQPLWSDPDLTPLVIQLKDTAAQTARASLYADIQPLLIENPPFLYLYTPVTIEAINTAVQNYQPRQNGITFFKEVVLFIP
ncbi:MAG: ABC transporter substrate-binding protein [Anaerolineales bacterium]|nr:ABC transporter substrate-binding protein [Anaerolineales bacterium]